MQQIYDLAIVGRATWDLHSLNNEGSIGNVTEPRTVMLADGAKSDGVSGEMLKHVHVSAFWQIGREELPLCENCRKLEPNKANKEPTITAISGSLDALTTAIRQCALCDLHGFLVEKPTINRASCIEFGWAVGLPGHNHRDLHLHARHAVGERAKPSKADQGATAQPPDNDQNAAEQAQEGPEAAGTSQMVYNRPTRSGQYAVVSVLSPWRIGLEHFEYKYVIDEDERKRRYQHALRAYQAMFWRPEGAMTTTRLPHVEGFSGAVVISTTNLPAPVVSGLADDYLEQLDGLVDSIGEGLEVRRFGNVAEFVLTLTDLADTARPYTIKGGTDNG